MVITLPAGYLLPAIYKFDFDLHSPNVEFLDRVNDVIEYEIEDSGTEYSMYKNVDFGNVVLPTAIVHR
ncbi:MAG: hypothetical protein EOO44_09740 [Flavobacterium sp.]|nr:MAG: hypothetical protein EOO44_09740 [Flavobacterium sp.]